MKLSTDFHLTLVMERDGGRVLVYNIVVFWFVIAARVISVGVPCRVFVMSVYLLKALHVTREVKNKSTHIFIIINIIIMNAQPV